MGQERPTINGLRFSTILLPDRIMHSASRIARYTHFQHLYAGTNHLTYAASPGASDLLGTQLPGVDSEHLYPWRPRELQKYVCKLLQGLGVPISGENQPVSTQADCIYLRQPSPSAHLTAASDSGPRPVCHHGLAGHAEFHKAAHDSTTASTIAP